MDLHHYGLDVDLLTKVYDEIKAKKKGSIAWSLKGIPEVGFYKDLHSFLKHWVKTCSASIVELGKFYIAIDKNLQAKQMRADNVYRFVEKVATSNLPRNTVVNYNLEKSTVKVLQSDVKHCTEEMEKLIADFAAMKLQLEDTKKELDHTQKTLGDVINEMKSKNSQMLHRKTCELEEFSRHTTTDTLSLVEEIETIKEENIELSNTLASVQKELSTFITDAVSITVDPESNFIIETRNGGKQYSEGIRRLYYTLLADQVATSS